MSPIVVDGKLTIPLFHGTSSLFYDSIRETGLGGRQMLEEIGVRATIRELMNYPEQLQQIPDWEWEKPYLLRIAEVDQNPTGSFLRYCGTYLTPSKQTAAGYTLRNRYGSEGLACTMKILKYVAAQLPELASKEPFSKVLAFASQPRFPLVVEARDVQEDWLRSERGQPCGPVLGLIEQALEDPEMFDIMSQQDNFELVHPVPTSHLRFYKILSPQSGYESFEDLRVELLPDDFHS